MSALWTSDEIAAATGGTASASFEVTGVTFDSREVGPGDLFVAMPGTVHDGHKFVDVSLRRGRRRRDRVAAGRRPARAGRGHVRRAPGARPRFARAQSHATIFGVTGSVGKTSTKEALYAALDRNRPGKVHRSVKSYNNHTGVPLSLARMPRDAEYAVLEMGMNNAGEIARLTRQVRPNVALITAIAPAHIENLGSEEAIADAKAEIFEGLEPDGIAIIPNDTPHRDRLVKAARRHADRIVTFGGGDADVHAVHAVAAEVRRKPDQRRAAGARADLHHLAARRALGVERAGGAGGGRSGRRGRRAWRVSRSPTSAGSRAAASATSFAIDGGEVLLIDESYNANPASMAATLKSLGEERDVERRIAVLGPMRELGEHSDALHAGLAPAVLDAQVDRLILIGDEMRPLAEQVRGEVAHRPRRKRRRGDGRADAACFVPATPCWSRRRIRSGWPSSSSGWQGASHALRDRRAARLPRRPQPDPLHQLPRRRGERDRAADRPAARARGSSAGCALRQGKGQPIRADGPQSHLAKRGTPTMGGLLILTSVSISVLLWMNLANPYVWACLLVTAGFGLIGWLDDYDKVKKAHHAGLSGKMRLALEFADRRRRDLADRAHRRHRASPALRQGNGRRPRLVLHRCSARS